MKKTPAAKPAAKAFDVGAYLNDRFTAAQESRSKVSEARESALRYYRQDMSHIPSNEGESAINTAEVRDAIEALLPQILEPFITGEGAGTFEPTGEGDVDQAKLETAYVKHVIFNQNNGFLIFLQWVKDGLLQKNGYVKSWWNEETSVEPESYRGISLDEADKVVADDAGPIVEISMRGRLPDGRIVEDLQTLSMLPPEVVQQLAVDIDLVRKVTNQQVFVAPVAPENMIIEARYESVDLTKANYCAERMFKTRAELKAAGYDPKTVNKLPKTSAIDDAEASERASDQDNDTNRDAAARGDDEVVEVRDHYCRSDLDGSGVVKLWKVCTGGGGSNIELDREIVSSIPYSAWTPLVQPHQHFGTSAAELVNDLQDIHTVLWRQSLNAVVANNRTRPIVNEDNTTVDTYDDILKTMPGHPIRVKGLIGESLQYTSPPNTALQTLPIMEYLGGMVETRTGLNKQAAGLDAKALADSTNLVGAMVMNQSLLRVKMMLRTFAETGVRHLMEHVRELVMKNEKREVMFEHIGKFVKLDPTDWRGKRKTSIKVGLGFNDRVEKVTALENTYAKMKEIVATQGGVDGPLVTLENSFNVLEDLLTENGLVAKGRYINNPMTNPPKPQPPSPTAIDVAEAEIVAKTQTEAAKLEVQKKKNAADHRLKLLELYLQDRRERESLKLESVKTFMQFSKDVNESETVER